MKRKLSGSGPWSNHIFLLLVLLIPLIDFSTEKKLGSMILIIILVGVFCMILINLIKLRLILFDEEFVYVKYFRSTIQLSYSQIQALTKSPGSFTVNESKSYHAYKMEYIDDYGNLKKIKFYVTDFLAFAAFQRKLFSIKPQVEFKPHGGRPVEPRF